MQANIITFHGPRSVSLETAEVPALQPAQVLVRTTVSLVSTGTESFCYRGEFEANTTWAGWVKYPFTPGYSAVGRVVAASPDVTHLKPGDRVYNTHSHRSLAIAGAAGLIAIPDGISDEDAAWTALARITQTAVRRAEHAMGDTAVVIGLGPLGQLVTQYLRAIGLREIIAIDTVQHRLDLALQLGATSAFNGSAADAKEFILARTESQLADVVYDATGHHAVLPLALPLARDFGKVLLLGDSPHPSRQHLTQDVLARQVSIIGTHNMRLQPQHAWWTADRQARLFFAYMQRGLMRTAPLTTHRFRPDQCHETYELLQINRAATLGVFFDWRTDDTLASP